jgi:hypothetical protein
MAKHKVKYSLDWCTCDWGGGSNYGPYTFREVVKVAWSTRKLNRFERQAITLSLQVERRWQTDDYTLSIFPFKFRLHHFAWPNWERFFAESRDEKF